MRAAMGRLGSASSMAGCVVCAALVVWAVRHTAQNLGVNTNTADMISPDLSGRPRREFQASFQA